MASKRSCLHFAMLAAVAALAAGCGGGGGGSSASANNPPPSGTAITEGAYSGNITGGTVPAFQMLVLDGGEVWAMYGTQSGSTFGVVGFVQGTLNVNTTALTFTSTNARDFGVSPSSAATVSGSYTSAPAISGSLTTSAGTVQFAGGPIAGSTYNYNTAPSLAAIAGTWTVFSTGGGSATLTIQSSGAYSADDGTGCIISGNLTPRPGGKNVFNVTTTYGSNCGTQSGATGGGIAVAYPLTNGQTQLVVGLIKNDRSLGIAVFGQR